MSQILENHFAILLDEATEENQISKKKQKQLLRALNPTTVDVNKPTKKAEEKKKTEAKKPAEGKKEEEKKTEQKPVAKTTNWSALPAAAAPVSKPVSHEVVAADNGAAEKQTKLKIERPKREDMTVRPGQRQFDRHSGTGRGTEQRKDGAGKANWGNTSNGKEALAQETAATEEAVAEKKKDEAEMKQPAVEGEKKEGETAVPVPAPKPEVSYVDYMKAQAKAKESAPKFAAAKAVAAVEDEADYSHMQQVKAAEAQTAVKAAPKKSEKKTEKKEEKAEKVDLQLKFFGDEEKQAQKNAERAERGGFRGGRGGARGGFRGGDRRPQPAAHQAASPKAAPQEIPKAEAFPVLKKK